MSCRPAALLRASSSLASLALQISLTALSACCALALAGLPLAASEAPTPAAVPAPGPASVPPLPALPSGTLEIHGTWDGQPYWARVLPPDSRYGGQRLMQLSWQPPAPASIGGVRLVDCPLVLLDAQGRVMAWNGRDSLSQAMPGTPDGYQVSREIETGSGDDVHAVEHKRIIHGPRGWDLQLAPLILALTWHDGSEAEVPIVDLFGMRGDHQLTMRWKARQAIVASQGLLLEPARDGSCARILDATSGAVRLSVEGRTQGSP